MMAMANWLYRRFPMSCGVQLTAGRSCGFVRLRGICGASQGGSERQHDKPANPIDSPGQENLKTPHHRTPENLNSRPSDPRAVAQPMASATTTTTTSPPSSFPLLSSYSDTSPPGDGHGHRFEESFGFRRVAEDMKSRLVGKVFSNVADSYDLMNDLMSFGIHRTWKNEFVSLIDPPIYYQHESTGMDGHASSYHVLDVAGGTGDIAFKILEKAKRKLPFGCASAQLPLITVCDVNKEMLRVGRMRAQEAGMNEISWVFGDGEALPIEDSSIDVLTIAFGIRNFTHIDKGLREAYRVLKPGGRFLCLEFGKVQSSIPAQVYDAYSFWVIPTMGQLVANDRESYQYLVESIRKFHPQEEFAQLIWDAGFRQVSYTNLTLGVVAIHSGFKIGN